jgi:hypothetical protein
LAEIPKPVDRKTPPDPVIHRELYLKKLDDEKRRKPVKIKLKKEHDPKHWEEQYREKYGDSAAQVGYGRALHERAKSISAKEALEIIDGLPAAKSRIGISKGQLDSLVAETKLSNSWDDLNTAPKLMASHARLCGSRTVPAMEYAGGTATKPAREAVESFYGSFVSPKIHLPEKTYWDMLQEHETQRSNWSPAFDIVSLSKDYDAGVAVHEYGHAVETMGSLSSKSRAFIRSRTRGESLVRLDSYPGRGYRPDELTRPDKFYDPYIGKDYAEFKLESGEIATCTELVSTVLGDIASGKAEELLRQDPETLYFVLGLMAGI